MGGAAGGGKIYVPNGKALTRLLYSEAYGVLITAGVDGALRLWELASGSLRKQLPAAHFGSAVTGACISHRLPLP